MMCFEEATGKLLWQLVVPKRQEDKYFDWPEEGMSSPATVEGERVYYVTNRHAVVCLDVKGMANGNDGPFKDEARHRTPHTAPPPAFTPILAASAGAGVAGAVSAPAPPAAAPPAMAPALPAAATYETVPTPAASSARPETPPTAAPLKTPRTGRLRRPHNLSAAFAILSFPRTLTISFDYLMTPIAPRPMVRPGLQSGPNYPMRFCSSRAACWDSPRTRCIFAAIWIRR
jgi:hypothetical protein